MFFESFRGRIWGDKLDEIRQQIRDDPQVNEWVESSVEETDSSVATDTALQEFQKIVSLVLECDQDGMRKLIEHGHAAI